MGQLGDTALAAFLPVQAERPLLVVEHCSLSETALAVFLPQIRQDFSETVLQFRLSYVYSSPVVVNLYSVMYTQVL